MPARTPCVLTAIADSVLADQVRTAVRQCADWRPLLVHPSRLVEALSTDAKPAAVILDHPGQDRDLPHFVEAIRERAPEIEILLLGERTRRKESYRAKLDLGVFSFIPTPLDPFDLARRLHRLRSALV